MLHKRERFERTDVPRSDRAGLILACAAGAFVLIGLVISLRWSWVMAHRDANLGDRTLKTSIKAQGEVAAPKGYKASSDIFTNVVIFSVDNPNAAKPKLHAIQLLSINVSKGTGSLVSIPADTKLTTDKGDTTLSARFDAMGASACIAPLSSAINVRLSHAIVGTDDIWEHIAQLKGAGMQSLIGSSTKILESIKSDMTFGEMTDLAERTLSIGIDKLARSEAPTADAKLKDGTQAKSINANKLNEVLGTQVAAK